MKNPTVFIKFRVLGALEIATGNTLEKRIQDVAENTFLDEEGNSRKFTESTISSWYYLHKNQGIQGLQSHPRSDKGKTRKMTAEELFEAIEQAKTFLHNPQRNKSKLYKICFKKGIFRKDQISQTKFYRLIRKHGWLKDDLPQKKRLAFSMEYANQLWQADTMYGPYVKNGTKPVQTKLIAFLDDASRVVCHGEFFFNETIDTLVQALQAALYKRGIPEQIYVDNGSIYTSKEISLICVRLGSILRHAPVRDGAAKGKIERFFRNVRDRFLTENLDLSSLETLNRQFITWLEEEYNSKIHSAIGMSPIDRFGLDLSRIRFLAPCEAHDELFFCEDKRKVKKDNTFSFNNIRYEAPRDLRGKTIQIRFNRRSKNKVIVYFNQQRLGEAKRLNLVQNGLLRKKK